MNKLKQNIIFLVSALFYTSFLNGQTYTFTNAGATGREGPTQAQVDANYSGTNLDGAVTVNTQGIQEWTVPVSGTYKFEVKGAEGGFATVYTKYPGKGASVEGKITLSSGTLIKIIIGQKGSSASHIGGGGGGTYIWISNSSIPLFVAGGGGGASKNSNGGYGLVSLNGGHGTNLSQGGGIDGNGSSHPGVEKFGAGGAGWLSDGFDAESPGYSGSIATGGKNPSNGGMGGNLGGLSKYVGSGGFGGGGGGQGRGSDVGSGGGGGYSGGGGGPEANGFKFNAGGGGGSYNSGTDQNNTAGANEGDGLVIITFLGSANEAPVIFQGEGPISKSLNEDTSATWTASELNATDADTNASSLAWSLVTAPSHGTAVVDGNGSYPTTLSYQPNANYHGSDSFSVQVSDGENNDSITINLSISAVDDTPIIIGDTNASIAEDSSASGDLNATDADGLTDGSYFSISTAPANGSASIDPMDGKWTYLPNPNFFGSDSFVVSVTDDLNTSTTTTINLFISAVDDTPIIIGDTNASIAEDSSASGDLNATDADGLTDGSYFSISTTPANGSASIDPMEGKWTYLPTPNFFGSDSFVVSVTDDLNTSTTTTINLFISAVDDATSINGDTNASIAEDSSASGDLNATDVDGLTDGSYFSISTTPANGSASIDPIDGNWTYSPSTNFFGSDSFTVTITDDEGNTTTQLVTLTINPVDDPSIITGNISGVLNEDSILSGDLNATDIDGLTDGSYFSISSSTSTGTLSLNPESGRWTYYPNSNTYGNDSFSVTITDDQNFTSTQFVSLTINPVNDPVYIFGDMNASIAEDSIASGDLNATDIDGLTDGSYFTISSNASKGTALIDVSDGNWTYFPNPNIFGSDSFTVTITDDQGFTATQEIALSINSVDDISTITGDSNASITEDSNASGDLNATDIDGLTDGSYFSISSNPGTGSASIDPVSGAWSYSPSANVFGTDSFTVTVTDDLNFTATQVISVIINAVDDPTVITGEFSGKLYLDHNVSGDINATDIDGLTDGSYFSISTNPANGIAQIDPVTGQWNYAPASGFLGDDSFVIQITDDQGFTSNQLITVVPQYNVPVAQTGATTLSSGGKPTFSGLIKYNGGLPILEVGFYTSSSSQFLSSEKLTATLDNNASFFTADLNRTDLASALFVRAFARNQNGETLGEIKRLDPPPIVMQWSSHATSLDNGWLQSDWFGNFRHYPKNWIFHSRLGWLYIPDSNSQNLWIWSPEHSWLWTQKGIFPHLYKNSIGDWIYLLKQETQGKNIYDYQSGLFK